VKIPELEIFELETADHHWVLVTGDVQGWQRESE